MFLVVHATVGAAVGSVVPNPASVFAINFFGHFLLDMIPHGDDHLYSEYKKGNSRKLALWYTGLDILVTIIVVSVILAMGRFESLAAVLAGIIGGLLPDVFVGLCEVLKPGKSWLGRRLVGFEAFHMWNHHFLIAKLRKQEKDIPMKYGFLMQAVFLVVLVRMIL
ncbi:MAG: hypothetical protein U9Q03_05200 [Patescibacteria group bacterium]|nr:hypothetical protein [Patescibacteria group bacterium]